MKYTTNILNIKDYGVISDRKTDTADAINHAIKILNPQSSIVFPKGDYLVSKTLNLSYKNNITVIFDEKAVLIPKNKRFDAVHIKGNSPKKWFHILKYDALRNSNFIGTTELLPHCVIGTYIALKSDKLLAGLNARKTYQYEYRKITKITTGLINVYYFDIPLHYDFLISDNAQIGLANVLDNITLINPHINTKPESENELLGRGIIANHTDNLKIQNPSIFYAKQAGKASSASEGLSAIILNACINATLTDINIKHIGWYGVAITGACYNILVKKGFCQDMRHAIDASVWITGLYTYQGEPNHITIQDIESLKSTESGFSTHDTGNHIKFIRCISKESGTVSPSYGFIFRNPSVESSYCIASHSTLDGFNCKEGVQHAKIDYPTAFGNHRDGISCTKITCDIYQPNVFGNKKSGIYASNGTIKGGSSLDNSFAFRVDLQKNNILHLEQVYAKQSERQKICFLLDKHYDEDIKNYIDFKECYFEDYTQNSLFYIV